MVAELEFREADTEVGSIAPPHVHQTMQSSARGCV